MSMHLYDTYNYKLLSFSFHTHFSFFLSFFFFFLPFLELLPRHMEAPRLGDLITAVAVSLCQSHSNTGSEPSLRPTSQLTATPDP